MTFTAIDCQSFAGGFTYGVVSSGFELAAKREGPGGFGVPAVEANRHLITGDWKTEIGEAQTWTPIRTDFVFGNPPCSGFSNRSSMVRQMNSEGVRERVEYRGINATPNQCMWDLVTYAAKCDPKIVVFESVQGAFRQGQELMQALRTDLETKTGDTWDLFHVLHNVTGLGGAQVRNRYFWVASRIPFGINNPMVSTVTVQERIGDLEDKNCEFIEGHIIMNSPRARRISELANNFDWLPGEVSGSAYKRAIEAGVIFSEENWSQKLVTDKGTTQFAPKRLKYDKPANVLAGDCLQVQVHPVLPRTLTYREVARLFGYPDSWITKPYQEKHSNSYWFGKGVCVEAGQWIASAVHDALAGNPQSFVGDSIGHRENLIDFSNWYKKALKPDNRIMLENINA